MFLRGSVTKSPWWKPGLAWPGRQRRPARLLVAYLKTLTTCRFEKVPDLFSLGPATVHPPPHSPYFENFSARRKKQGEGKRRRRERESSSLNAHFFYTKCTKIVTSFSRDVELFWKGEKGGVHSFMHSFQIRLTRFSKTSLSIALRNYRSPRHDTFQEGEFKKRILKDRLSPVASTNFPIASVKENRR